MRIKITVIMLRYLSILRILLVTCVFVSCTYNGYRFGKFAVKTSANIAEDAGLFDQKVFRIPKQWRKDTLFYYKGVGRYTITENDTCFIVFVKIDKDKFVDTTLQYFEKLERIYRERKNKNRYGNFSNKNF